MAKFFIPILLFLIGLWIYAVISQQNKDGKVNDADKILKEFETYSRLHDSIKELPEYFGYTEANYKGLTFFVPAYLETTTDLAESAVLQYKNSKREFYLVLYSNKVDEYGEGFKDADQYAKATMESLRNNVTEFKMIDSSIVFINNCKAYRMDFTGNYNNGTENLPLKYKVLVAEYEQNLYDLTEWTIIDNLSDNEDDMNKILSSVINLPDVDLAREKIME